METDPSLAKQIDKYFNEAQVVLKATANLAEKIESAAQLMIGSLGAGGTIYWCGNGGSAADSQHLAAELIGKFKLDRAPLRSVALTTDTSILTATGNDFGFEHVFSRQLQALGRKEDLLIGISTSGRSVNVISAMKEAKKIGMSSVAMTGNIPNEMWEISDIRLAVPSSATSHIQEMHILMGQLICGLAEEHFFGKAKNAQP
jgi:D-sedoheptulose 7-phosphate isomerase